jgi:hypothetical protein
MWLRAAGEKPTYEIGKIATIVEATPQTKPAGMMHGSCRTREWAIALTRSAILDECA